MINKQPCSTHPDLEKAALKRYYQPCSTRPDLEEAALVHAVRL